MNKTCLKCGRPNPSASGDPLEACPGCGAIYSRVEAAWGARHAGAVPAAAPSAARPAPPVAHEPAESVQEFTIGLRLESLYPTFRSLVQLVYWLFVVLAVVCFAGALVGAWNSVGAARVGGFFGGVVLGLLFLIVAKVTREMSLMLADLADAAVRIASRVRP